MEPSNPGPEEMDENPDVGFTTLSDLEGAASRKLDGRLWAYVQGGAGEERTVRANLEAYLCWSLRPRALSGATTVDLRTSLLGHEVRAPFFIAPTAYHGQIDPAGEALVARAAQRAGVLSAYSTLSSLSLEEVSRASGDGVRWFQLYPQPDFQVSRRLVERAERAGYAAIIITVDTPVLGVRDRQARGGFAIDSTVPIGNGPEVTPPPRGPTEEGGRYHLRSDATSDWGVLDQIRSITRLPLVVKGILTAEDGRRAVEHGAKAIVVSNHGGRQLDGARASLRALPEVIEEVGSEAEVYVDGGARRGADILIARALGARAVGIGRPILWALAVGGERGVDRYLALLKRELATAMLLIGSSSLADVTSDRIAPAR